MNDPDDANRAQPRPDGDVPMTSEQASPEPAGVATGVVPATVGGSAGSTAPGAKPSSSGAGRGLPGRTAAVAAAAVGLGVAASVLIRGDLNVETIVAVAAFAFIGGNWAVVRALEGARKATDKLVTSLVFVAFALAITPLVSIVWTVVTLGLDRFDLEFFTSTMRGVLGPGGGALHAIVGTLIITGITALISVPVGLLTAIYLVEYGPGRLSRAITFLVDVMTGIPSIVAGLFAFALFSTLLGDAGHRSGIAAAVALSLLMIPIVVRACEEMLRLVPNRLRESSYALGVPKWLTITKVVIPTAIAGIVAGITISIARIIGETAPLLIVAGNTANLNTDPTNGFMSTLPVFTYFEFTQPGVPPEEARARAWTAALILILIVMLLNLVARSVARFFAPKLR